MLKCSVCDDIIKEKEFRASTYVGQKQLWACEECNGNGEFKVLIDKEWDEIVYSENTENIDNKSETIMEESVL